MKGLSLLAPPVTGFAQLRVVTSLADMAEIYLKVGERREGATKVTLCVTSSSPD